MRGLGQYKVRRVCCYLWNEGRVTYALALGGGVDELLAEVLPVLVVRGLLDNDLLEII